MRSEAVADVADDVALRIIDSDVIKKLVLKDGERYCDTSLRPLLLRPLLVEWTEHLPHRG